MEERLYYQNFNIAKEFGYNKLISAISLKMEIDGLNGQIWDHFYIYKLIKNVEISALGLVIFKTNGLIIKSKIDIFHPELQKPSFGYIHKKGDLEKYSREGGSFTIPLFITNSLYTNSTPILNIEINDLYSVKLFVKCEINPQPELNYPVKQIIKQNQSQIFNFDKNDMVVKKKISLHGLVDYILFVCDPTMIIDKIDFVLHGISQTYPYHVLNQLQPYYHLNRILPKNYHLMVFNSHGQHGLNFSKISECNVTFHFKKNGGGNIYVIAESNNIEHYDGFAYSMIYSYNTHIDHLSNDTLRSEKDDEFIRIEI